MGEANRTNQDWHCPEHLRITSFIASMCSESPSPRRGRPLLAWNSLQILRRVLSRNCPFVRLLGSIRACPAGNAATLLYAVLSQSIYARLCQTNSGVNCASCSTETHRCSAETQSAAESAPLREDCCLPCCDERSQEGICPCSRCLALAQFFGRTTLLFCGHALAGPRPRTPNQQPEDNR